MRSLARLLSVVLTLSAVVYCSNKTSPTQPGINATPTPMSTPPPGATPTPSAAHMVNVGPSGSMSFVDTQSGTNVTTIHAGQTVTWVWVSGTHSTTSGACCTANGTWDSGVMSGGSFSHTFGGTGSFPYFCTVHGSLMTGTVVVNP
jgi:plastocyanin